MINVRMPEEDTQLSPRITVVGVGGAGVNALNNMIQSNLQGVEFLACNSDAQSLKNSAAERKIQLGTNITRGLGCGARPDIGRAAAEESLDEVMGYLEGSNMAFITAGMGGGTGTGAAPIVARAAREAGILTVGVITKPFHFEGQHRMRLAEAGIEELQQYVDTLLIIPNQNLFRVANEKTTFADAFKMADDVLHSGVRGVTDLMVMPGLINLDFADIRSVMGEMGKAMMGTGEAEGDRRAVEAAEAAISNPLLEDVSMKGARGVLINITGGLDMTLFEVDEACNRIRDEVDPDANIIFGSTFNADLEGTMRVSVVATGIEAQTQRVTEPRKLSVVDAVSKTTTGATPATNTSKYATGTAAGAPVYGTNINTTATPTTETATTTQTASYARGTTATAAALKTDADLKPGFAEPVTNTVPETTALKEDSFIPPSPITVESKPVMSSGIASVSPDPFAEAEMANATAPAAPAPEVKTAAKVTPEKKKGGSLFDRLTGGRSIPLDDEEDQPSLEVEPKTADVTADIDDDLDIPAFLRRQAS